MCADADASRGVVHLDLAAAPAQLGSDAGAALAVFWDGERPVGHAFAADGRFEQELAAARARALLPRAAAGGALPRSASVVICTRDRPDALAECLRSLAQQTRKPDQILVVDNASADDRTRAVARDAGVDYLREPRAGLDIARNAGARAASGEVLAYTDDDVRLHPGWLAALVAAFDAPEIMAATGLVLPARLETPAQLHFERFWSFGRGYERIDFGPEFFSVDRDHGCPAWRVGAGASMAFRRECFARAGGFDERLDVGAAGCSGDSEYWHRLLSQGCVIRYEPGAVAFHVHRRDMEGLERQLFAYMRGHAAALLVQYERSGNRGNLRRALVTTPLWFARRLARRLLGRGGERDRMLARELAGYLSGLRYYLTTPRSLAGDRA